MLRNIFSPLKRVIQKHNRTITLLGSAAGLTAILINLEFNLLEANLYDLRVVQSIKNPPDQDIVMVSLDDHTTRELSDHAPLPLNYHVLLLQALERLRPKAVGYLVNMNHVHQINPDLFNGDFGSEFVRSVERLTKAGIPFILGTPFDVNGEILPPFPLSSLSHSIAVIHQDGNVFSEDKVTRRALSFLYNRPTFHMALAQAAGLISSTDAPAGSFYVPEVDGEYFLFHYHGNTTLSEATSGSKPGSRYARISFVDLIEGKISPEAIQDKIVLVGTIGRENPNDFTKTPFSKSSFTNPKLVVHANILDSVINNDGVLVARPWVNWATTFFVVLAVLWAVLTLTPLYSVFTTLGVTFLFLLVGLVVFQGLGRGLGMLNGIWINESQPLVGIFLAFYLAVPYRLIREYKKRWDYQQKNEVLIQVEELKTNFLSLVTHDLKTPVARIQGLAEVLRKSAKSLTDADLSTLNSIFASTEELNRFISSILELTKIQSNQLQISLESKDLNDLIERSVQGFRAQSAVKQIKLVTELEPLFPIKLDPSLISKVINNLIDNALKYSAPSSTVTIRSLEKNGCVEIHVQDQGQGLSEQERANLFTKFYRAKNDATQRVTGTGLGLYLTKFFVEAHKGAVGVESTPGNGSTFWIRIPIDLDESKLAPVKPGRRPGLKILAHKLSLNQKETREKNHV